MSVEIRSYEGTPNYIKGSPTQVTKRDGVKKTHRELVRRYRDIGDQALNAADYERTMHLPVGRGRLACDPETGEFDADAIRPQYNPTLHSPYPRYVHSTITVDENQLVYTEQEHQIALATKKWSDKPMERRKRFTLTPEDQMQDFKGQIEAERARNNQLERKLEQLVTGSSDDSIERASVMEVQLAETKRETADLKARMEVILAQLEAKSKEEPETVTGRKGK